MPERGKGWVGEGGGWWGPSAGLATARHQHRVRGAQRGGWCPGCSALGRLYPEKLTSGTQAPSPQCTPPTLTVPPPMTESSRHPPVSLLPGGAWRPHDPGSPAQAGAPHQGPSWPCSASVLPQPGGTAAPPVTLIPHPTPTLTPIPIAPPALSHHPPHPWEPSLVFLAASLGSLLSGHAPGGSSPHGAPPGSSEGPRKQTP